MSGLRPEARDYVESVCPGARVEPMAHDASTRRFFRIRPAAGPSRVLMDYGAPFERETDDVRMARVFREAGLRVAEVIDARADAGCLLLEDLGEVLLASALAQAGPTPRGRELVERAVRLAARVATEGTQALRKSAETNRVRRLDAARFRFEMEFFLEHFVRGLRKVKAPTKLEPALFALADRAAAGPAVLCHRDYHGRNLMLLGDGELAMVDIQDAQWGPDSYDLASLLRDAYVEIDERWIDPMIERYLSALDDAPPLTAFRERFECVAAQRMLKALGTFGHQISAHGQTRYRDAAIRTLHRLRSLLPASAETRDLASLLTAANLLTP